MVLKPKSGPFWFRLRTYSSLAGPEFQSPGHCSTSSSISILLPLVSLLECHSRCLCNLAFSQWFVGDLPEIHMCTALSPPMPCSTDSGHSAIQLVVLWLWFTVRKFPRRELGQLWGSPGNFSSLGNISLCSLLSHVWKTVVLYAFLSFMIAYFRKASLIPVGPSYWKLRGDILSNRFAIVCPITHFQMVMAFFLPSNPVNSEKKSQVPISKHLFDSKFHISKN